VSGYILDTSLVAAYLRGRPGAVALISPWIASHEVGTSIIVYGEAFEYLSGFADPGRWQAALRALPGTMPVFDLTYAIMERYAEVRRAMRPPHGAGLIGDMDTLIAATALVYDRTLVTLDSDYTRVPGLAVMLLPRSAL
jgi:predicted nucleic acid-binding protein